MWDLSGCSKDGFSYPVRVWHLVTYPRYIPKTNLLATWIFFGFKIPCTAFLCA